MSRRSGEGRGQRPFGRAWKIGASGFERTPEIGLMRDPFSMERSWRRRRFWAELTWRDFERLDMQRGLAVLPVAAVEQHGPHLPLGVDATLAEGYVRRSAESLPDDLPVLFLPLQAVGVSGEHAGFPGTLALSVETAIRAWTEIGESVARSGCRSSS